MRHRDCPHYRSTNAARFRTVAALLPWLLALAIFLDVFPPQRACAMDEAEADGRGALPSTVEGAEPAAFSEPAIADFGAPLSAVERGSLAAAGIKVLRPLGGGRYLVRLRAGVDPASLSGAVGLRRLEPLEASRKLHGSFANGRIPPWAIVEPSAITEQRPRADGQPKDSEQAAGDPDPPTGESTGPTIAAYVLFHADVDMVTDGAVTRHGGRMLSRISAVNAAVILLPAEELVALAEEASVLWIEPPLPAFEGVNNHNRQAIQADFVQSDYGLDGSGVSVLVFDAGGADAGHPDFGGRLTHRDTALLLDHSTHVSGTIGGDGLASGGHFRGMAPGVTIESYGFEIFFDGVTLPFFADPADIERDYDEAMNVYGTVVANNSIGTNICVNGFDCAVTGDYGVTSQLIDAIVAGVLGPPMRVVWAVGNERACTRCRDEGVHSPEGYRSIAPPAGAKNPIMVGAIQANDDAMTSFSSWGPTDDGRLKPDLVAPGCQVGEDFGVTSTVGGGGYFTFCGTSMAAPTVTGAVALLLEDHRLRFPARDDPLNAMVKALLLHTAMDVGRAGPDYQHGYGALRIKDAIDQARSDAHVEGQLDHGETASYLVRVEPGAGVLKATCAWDDAPAVPGSSITLINDLDLRVYDPDGHRYYPWTLDPLDPAAPAERDRADHRNNVEQVYVENPVPGLWLVEMYGYSVPAGPQGFSLVVSPAITDDCDGNGQEDADEIAADLSLDCSGNGLLDRCEIDCDGNGLTDSCEIAAGLIDDCDGDDLADTCASDCNGSGIPDACDIATSASEDCNRNGIPDDCEADCDGSGTPDACDIAAGLAVDCDGNGVPDSCQDTGVDCDANGVWDACESATQPEIDLNGNGVPDVCEASDRTFFVDAAACPAVGSGTAGDPFCTIQNAIDASISGNVVIVAPGVYSGAGNINLDFGGRLITLQSVDPSDAGIVETTIIDCLGAGRGFYFHHDETREAVIDGLTIRNGIAALGSTPGDYRGGGILCVEADPTIRRCVIEDCAAGPSFFGMFGGGGVYCLRSSPLIERCMIRRNTTFNHGAGIYCYDNSHAEIVGCTIMDNASEFGGGGIASAVLSNPVIRNCMVVGNSAPNFGGGLSLSFGSPVVRNCLIAHNTTEFDAAGVFLSFANATIENCTITENRAGDRGGGLLISSSSVAVRSSILWGNQAPQGAQASAVGSSAVVMLYDDVEGGLAALEGADLFIWDDSGNIEADPLFVDPSGDDFHLSELSPCVDGGDPRFVRLPGETDLDGDGRVFGGRVDIGSDEYIDRDCNDNGVLDVDDIADGTSADCDGNGIPDECEDCNGNGVADACDIAEGTSLDQNLNSVPDECEPTRTIYVDDDGAFDPSPGDPLIGDPAEDGTSDHPFDSIQEAIDAGESGDTVVVSPGLYAGLGNRDIDFGGRLLTLACAGQVEDCVIDAEGLGRVFSFQSGETADARLERLTIQHGWAVEGGGIIFTNSSPTIVGCHIVDNSAERLGGGIHCRNGSPVLRDCVLRGNRSLEFSGAGISSDNSSPSFLNCSIIENVADFSGGALYAVNISRPVFVNCLIAGNSAVRGGGLYLSGSGTVTIRRSTIAGNRAIDSFGAGLYLATSLAIFDGSILWGNLSSVGGHEVFFNSAGRVLFDYSTVALGADAIEGGGSIVWGIGNQFGDPLFVDALRQDFHLLPGSPCIDGGNPDVIVQRDETDLDGDPRVAGRGIDIGSDEFNVDCNANGVNDGDDIDGGGSIDCNLNKVPDECEPDCDGNGSADPCDLSAGIHDDCNANGIPDPCDVASGSSEDADGNGVLDECEPCVEASDCGDGLFCNGQERCTDGVCRPGPPVCQGRHCDEAQDECVECLADDDCADTNVCTADACLDGECVDVNVAGPCDDGNRCTSGDTCSGGGCAGEVIDGCGAVFSVRAASVNDEPLAEGASGYVRAQPGDLITIDLYVENWQPLFLAVYQVTIDGDGYRSGPAGSLAPLIEPTPQAGAFIDGNRSDFVFHEHTTITGVRTSDENYSYGALSVFGSVPDPDRPLYCGTLKIVVGEDAVGLFSLGLIDSNDHSFLIDPGAQPIDPLTLDPLTIFVDTDCNGNGEPDDADIQSGGSADCSNNGIPDECEPDCNENGVPDTCDVAEATSEDCNDNEIPDECEPDCNETGQPDDCDVADRLSEDCNGNNNPDECDVAPGGDSQDCDGNGIPDECEEDCNENGIVDDCDIAGGGSRDCNENGIPDECEPDCNENEVADACDIAAGDSLDEDVDGVPDECRQTLRVPEDHSTIQQAIDAAEPGDLVLIADGVYQGPGNYNLSFRGKALTVRGENGPDHCIIDPDGVARAFRFRDGEDATSRLEGVTVRNSLLGMSFRSGSSPLIRNCRIVENAGGGVSVTSSNPIFVNCRISGNEGVGVSLRSADASFHNVLIADNSGAPVIATNGSRALLVNVTITAHEGRILLDSGEHTLVSTIVWGIGGRGVPGIELRRGAELSVSHSDIEGGMEGLSVIAGSAVAWGAGNIALNPRFLDADGPDDDSTTWADNDYHLATISPCIDGGDPGFRPVFGDVDLDGKPRIQFGRVDMGADESEGWADCDGNGVFDALEIATGAHRDCTDDGVPDACELAQGVRQDCNANAVPDVCEVTSLFEATSGVLSPIGGEPAAGHVFVRPPKAVEAVTLQLTVFGDFDGEGESLDVYLNDTRVGTAFVESAHACPERPDVDRVVVDAQLFNRLVGRHDAHITLVPSELVNADRCLSPSFATIDMFYGATGTSFDANGNGVPDECEFSVPYIVDSAPPSGAIDARQPTEGEPDPVVGPWAFIDIVFSWPPDDPSEHVFFIGEEGGDGVAPTVVALAYPTDGVIRLHLSEPVELGAWTIVSHAGSDWTGCVGYQPGDVNEDRFSNVEDVATLVECLSGGTICDSWQSDIDRSDATTLNDLLRLVDLLNANPQDSPYLSEPLPENPCR